MYDISKSILVGRFLDTDEYVKFLHSIGWRIHHVILVAPPNGGPFSLEVNLSGQYALIDTPQMFDIVSIIYSIPQEVSS